MTIMYWTEGRSGARMGGWVIQNFSSKGASLVVGKIPKQLSVAGCFGWWKFLLGGLVVIWLGAVPGLVFVFVLFLAVLIASILTAPLKQRDELRGYVKGLQEKNEKLSVHSKTEPLVETLSNLHSQGAALISRKITDDSELSQLKVDMKEWSDTAAMWIAQNLSMAQGRLFERAALGKPIHKFLHEYNQEHRRVEHRAVEKTKYLQGLIDKYQG